jgi:hypothetical protein
VPLKAELNSSIAARRGLPWIPVITYDLYVYCTEDMRSTHMASHKSLSLCCSAPNGGGIVIDKYESLPVCSHCSTQPDLCSLDGFKTGFA